MDKKIVDNILRIFTEGSNRHALDIIPFAGTLLGYVRDGGPMSWDRDVDVAVKRPDIKNFFFVKELQAAGIKLKWIDKFSDGNFKFKFSFSDIPIDLYVLSKEGDFWVNRCIGPGRFTYRYRYTDYTAVKKNIGGLMLNVPEDPEKFLEQCYGPDWKTPDPAWDGYLSPHNLITDPFKTKDNFKKHLKKLKGPGRLTGVDADIFLKN